MSIVNDLIDGLDDILGIVDDIGAKKHDVYILTRTWEGPRIGQGEKTDIIDQVLPSPHLVDFSHNINVKTGGAIDSGDIMLKMISKESYPEKEMIDCSVDKLEPNSDMVQRYYYIDGRLYEVKSVVSNYVTWNVLLKHTNKKADLI